MSSKQGDNHLVPPPRGASRLCGPRGVSRISDPASLDQAVVKLRRPPTASPVQIFQILKLEINNNVHT